MADYPGSSSRIAPHASRISKVGIIGEGKMGTGIFHYLLDYPFELAWLCSREADLEKLNRQFGKRIRRALEAGIIDQGRFDRLATSRISKDRTALQSCDLIIEAVPEIRELKQELFSQLDTIVNPGAIFASNTSSVKLSEIAPAGKRKGQFTGLHFFYPVPLKNIVEFTVTADTTGDTVGSVEQFLHEIRRRFITLDEKSSFMLNRIFLDFQNEAFLIVRSGHCSYNQMDQLVKKHIFPFGVFDFCDSVGLDTMLSSIRNYICDYPHKSYYAGFIEVLEGLVGQGKLGVKTQEGFFQYPAGEFTGELPDDSAEIADHLHRTYILSARRFTGIAHIPIDDANHAIREYFDIPRGPFE